MSWESPELRALLRSKSFVFRPLKADEVAAAHAIEAASYPEDEAASLQNFAYRQQHAVRSLSSSKNKHDTRISARLAAL
jgi:hypothetical protein